MHPLADTVARSGGTGFHSPAAGKAARIHSGHMTGHNGFVHNPARAAAVAVYNKAAGTAAHMAVWYLYKAPQSARGGTERTQIPKNLHSYNLSFRQYSLV